MTVGINQKSYDMQVAARRDRIRKTHRATRVTGLAAVGVLVGAVIANLAFLALGIAVVVWMLRWLGVI